MLDEEDRKVYDKLETPKSMVVRYGYMKSIAELPYNGESKPGCGSRVVMRTERGTELAEMLTTTCPNSGCGSAVSRKQMLEYIDKSGGKKYPFGTRGKVLRVATTDDVREQEHEERRKPEMIRFAKKLIIELDLPMALVDIELLLGGERIIFHYTSEQWVDFRDLVKRLATEYQTRIEMHQVNARDEARLVADYERCGQQCCCKQFLKVLKPVSMRSAKVQKATLDPAKISGRCGRLMCCLRYEDKTYEDLRKCLPNRQSRVMTEDGIGTVLSTQILTQLALVKVDDALQAAAYPIENIRVLTKEEIAEAKVEAEARAEQAERERAERSKPYKDRRKPRAPRREHSGDRTDPESRKETQPPRKENSEPSGDQRKSDKPQEKSETSSDSTGDGKQGQKKRRRRRRRRGRGKGKGKGGDGGGSGSGGGDSPSGGGS